MKKKKNNRWLAILFLAVVLVALFVAYAIFTYQKTGTKQNELTTGTLVLKLDETKGNAIDLSNVVPVLDETGLETDPYQFTLINEGSLSAQYRIRLEYDEDAMAADGCTDKTMAYSQVKYALWKQNNTTDDASQNDPALLSTLTDHILDAGTLTAGDSNDYALRLWIDSQVGDNGADEINGKHLHVRLVIDAIVEGHTDWETGQ